MYSFDFVIDSTLRISVAFVVLTFLTSVLRFLLRIQLKVAISADDYWLVVSLSTFYGFIGMLLWGLYLARYLGSSLTVSYNPCSLQPGTHTRPVAGEDSQGKTHKFGRRAYNRSRLRSDDIRWVIIDGLNHRRSQMFYHLLLSKNLYDAIVSTPDFRCRCSGSHILARIGPVLNPYVSTNPEEVAA